jgi:hypothetical protein
MSKRISLADATARKKEQFVMDGPSLASSRPRAWEAEEPEAPPVAPAPAVPPVRVTRSAPNVLAEEFPKKKTTFNIDAALHRRLKLTAVREEREMVDIVEEALANHLRTIDRASAE